MATTPLPSPITVLPNGQLVAVPVGSSGGSVVNDGTVPVTLNPTNPAQGAGTIVLPGGATPWPANTTCYASVPNGSISPGQIYFIPGITVYAQGDLTAGGAGIGGGANGVTYYETTTPIPVGQSVEAFILNDLPPQFTILNWGVLINQTYPTPPSGAGFATLVTSFYGGVVPEGTMVPKAAFDIITGGPGVEWASDRLSGVSVNTSVPGIGTIDGPVIYNEMSQAGGCMFFINVYNTSDD